MPRAASGPDHDSGRGFGRGREASGSDHDSGRGFGRRVGRRTKSCSDPDDGVAGESGPRPSRNRGRSGISTCTEPSGGLIVLNSDPTPIALAPHPSPTPRFALPGGEGARPARHRGQITIQDEASAGGLGGVRNRALTPMTGWPETAGNHALHHRNRGRSGISTCIEPSGDLIVLNSDPTPIALAPPAFRSDLGSRRRSVTRRARVGGGPPPRPSGNPDRRHAGRCRPAPPRRGFAAAGTRG